MADENDNTPNPPKTPPGAKSAPGTISAQDKKLLEDYNAAMADANKILEKNIQYQNTLKTMAGEVVLKKEQELEILTAQRDMTEKLIEYNEEAAAGAAGDAKQMEASMKRQKEIQKDIEDSFKQSGMSRAEAKVAANATLDLAKKEKDVLEDILDLQDKKVKSGEAEIAQDTKRLNLQEKIAGSTANQVERFAKLTMGVSNYNIGLEEGLGKLIHQSKSGGDMGDIIEDVIKPGIWGMAQGFAEVLNLTNLTVSALKAVGEQTADIVKIQSTVTQETGRSAEYAIHGLEGARDAANNLAGSKIFSREDMAPALTALTADLPKFTTLSEAARSELVATTAMLGKVGVEAADTVVILNQMMSIIPQEAPEAAANLKTMTEEMMAFGITPREFTQNLATMLPRFSEFGEKGGKIFTTLSKKAKLLNVSVEDIVESVSGFDTFEDAAPRVGKLNALMSTLTGTNADVFNSFDLVMAVDPEEKFKLISNAVEAAGLSLQDMATSDLPQHKFALRALAQEMNTTTDSLIKMYNSQIHLSDEAYVSGKTLEKTLAEATTPTEIFQAVMQDIVPDLRGLAMTFREVVQSIASWDINLLRGIALAIGAIGSAIGIFATIKTLQTGLDVARFAMEKLGIEATVAKPPMDALNTTVSTGKSALAAFGGAMAGLFAGFQIGQWAADQAGPVQALIAILGMLAIAVAVLQVAASWGTAAPGIIAGWAAVGAAGVGAVGGLVTGLNEEAAPAGMPVGPAEGQPLNDFVQGADGKIHEVNQRDAKLSFLPDGPITDSFAAVAGLQGGRGSAVGELTRLTDSLSATIELQKEHVASLDDAFKTQQGLADSLNDALKIQLALSPMSAILAPLALALAPIAAFFGLATGSPDKDAFANDAATPLAGGSTDAKQIGEEVAKQMAPALKQVADALDALRGFQVILDKKPVGKFAKKAQREEMAKYTLGTPG